VNISSLMIVSVGYWIEEKDGTYKGNTIFMPQSPAGARQYQNSLLIDATRSAAPDTPLNLEQTLRGKTQPKL
jgi:hypothetical protein